MVTACLFSSYVLSVSHSLAASCQRIIWFGAIFGCHPTEPVFASSVRSTKKKSCHFYVPFSIINSSMLSISLSWNLPSLLIRAVPLAVLFLFSPSVCLSHSKGPRKGAGFHPLLPPTIYSFRPIYLPVLLPVCPPAESF